jgi:myosin-crossreactive antigen
MKHHGLATDSLKPSFYKPVMLHDVPCYMPYMNCKTFIHRFDSDRRLQSFQEFRDNLFKDEVVRLNMVWVEHF